MLNKYDLYFLTYKELDFSNYKIIDEYKNDYKFVYFDKSYFESIKTYSDLCLTTELYKKFADYDYMFLYQLDGWIFKDELEYWCNQGYDYIGAPWFEGHSNATENDRFINPGGNGGVSLRNIQKFIKILENKTNYSNIKLFSYEYYLRYLEKFKVSGIRKYVRALLLYLSPSNYLGKFVNEDMVIVRYFPVADKTFKIAP